SSSTLLPYTTLFRSDAADSFERPHVDGAALRIQALDSNAFPVRRELRAPVETWIAERAHRLSLSIEPRELSGQVRYGPIREKSRASDREVTHIEADRETGPRGYRDRVPSKLDPLDVETLRHEPSTPYEEQMARAIGRPPTPR